MTEQVIRPGPRDDELAVLLTSWLPGRRWFPAKDTPAEVRALGGTTLTDPEHEADVRLLLIRVRAAQQVAVLQVPLVLRPADDLPAHSRTDTRLDEGGSLGGDTSTSPGPPLPVGTGPTRPHSAAGPEDPPAADLAEVGRLADGTRVRDGSADPVFVRAWLAAADSASGTPIDLAGLGTPHLISGEQSNSSAVLPGVTPDGSAGILKVFRSLSDGQNPDVDVPRALARAGWPHVPRPLAWMSASWPENGGTAHGHLGVLSAFVPGADDGFELACAMAGRGESFGTLARELGEVIAQLHRALAAALPVPSDGAPTPVGPVPDLAGPTGEPPVSNGPAGPTHDFTEPASDPAAQVVADSLSRRYTWALAAVPALAEHADAVAALADRVALLTGLPARQRVHGDLHLGQVLRADTWYVLDFEGEPLRPVAERIRPDLPLRDAAGMLRSFDYAAAVGGAPEPWTRVARDEFWAGYEALSPGLDPTLAAVLLRALELDKALYEAVYEARNRPAWQHIPLRAIARLLT